MSVKNMAEWAVKSADEGIVTAVFATLGVRDSDGDVTLPGAFKSGAETVISAYGHQSWRGELPVGKGRIEEIADKAVLTAEFFLDTQAGRDTFTAVKRLGGLGQWSYGYDPDEFSYGQHEGKQVRFLKALTVYEVSPVLVGAGVGTGTISAKSGGSRLVDEAGAVVAALEGLVDRCADVVTRRAAEGKSLGAETRSQLDALVAQVKRLEPLIGTSVPVVDEVDPAAVASEYARYLRAITTGA